MNFFKQTIPAYIYKKRNQITMVLFAALFALIFINTYTPFNSLSWGEHISQFRYLAYSSLLVLAGLAIVAISRIAMHYYTKRKKILYWQYMLWVAVELILMAAVYTVCSVTLGMQSDVIEAFKTSLYNTSLVLLLPYIISIIYFAKLEKDRLLEEIKDDEQQSQVKNLITFYDEKGELRLSVKRENLIYIESADNYVCIHYLNSGQLKKSMIRNTMKKLTEELSGTNIMRCHRSYLVNLDQVKVLRREKDGVYLELGIPNVMDIPISKTYSESIKNWLMNS